MDELLKIWSEAGERPYELLQELNRYEEFLDYLNKSILNIKIYRGTTRHKELEVNDTLTYLYATSWSFDFEVAKKFIQHDENGVILVLELNNIKGVINNNNSYDEKEVVIAPNEFKVINKYYCKNNIIIELINVV